MALHAHGIPNHVCMLDGPDYPSPTAKMRHDELVTENERLKSILLENGISWAIQKPKAPVYVRLHKMKTRRGPATSEKRLPHLPMEIQLRILRFAMARSFPIIDPFFKARNENLTKEERAQREELPIRILGTCKAYHKEGYKLFFNNSFVFTQVAALENFSNVSLELRSTVIHVTLRVVGKYYDDESSKRNLLNIHYHPAAQDFKIPVYARPKGAENDDVIHAYCWQQFADFMMNLQIPSGPRCIAKLFPSLRRMRVDLVNFSDHLHYPGPSFASILRWQAGPFLDELIMTGVPSDDLEDGLEQMLTRTIKDEGVFGSGLPIFVSLARSLKTLPPLGLAVRVIRADEDTRFIRSIQIRDSKLLKSVCASLDPEDGTPPVSYYPSGRTIWKFTQDSLCNPERRWIEFERETGWPADDVDIWSDNDESVMNDSEDAMANENSNAIDSDDNLHDSDDDIDDNHMPALLAVSTN